MYITVHTKVISQFTFVKKKQNPPISENMPLKCILQPVVATKQNW